jgi:hypothetical protein
MIKHTAAPWHQGGYEVQDDKGALICNLSGWRGEQQTLANARLIAAAPELLKALKEICDCPQFVDEATVPKAGIEVAPQQVVINMSVALVRLRKAQAAIAKAEVTK